MNRLEFAARLVLIYAAGVLGAIGAHGDIAAPFSVLSLFLTAELATRKPGRETVDRIVRICGSTIVALVLGGLVLNLIPSGLTRQSWSAFWVVISLVVLWWKRRESTSLDWLQKSAGTQTVWFGAATVVLLLATVVAVTGANNDLKSPVQMWVQGKSPGLVTVAVSSGHDSGRYRLVVSPDVTKTNTFDVFDVAPGQAVERSISVAGNTRYGISLVDAATGTKIREVIVDSVPLATS